MKKFQFQVDYEANTSFDHSVFETAFTELISSTYSIEGFDVKPSKAMDYKATHSATIVFSFTTFQHSNLFGQVHKIASKVGVKVHDIPQDKMRFIEK